MSCKPFALNHSRYRQLTALLGEVAQSSRAATRLVRAARPPSRRLRQASHELVSRALRAALGRPGLSATLLLACIGSACSLWVGNETTAGAVQDVLGVVVAFLALGFAFFGVPLLPDVRRNHYDVDAPGALAQGRPELFLSLFREGADLVGHRVCEEGLSLQLLKACPEVTTDQVPTAYVALHAPDGQPLYLINVATLNSYAWFAQSPLLRHHRHAWAQAFQDECLRRGVFDALTQIVSELAADAAQESPNEVSPPVHRLQCRCGTTLVPRVDAAGQPQACPQCAATFECSLQDGRLEVAWLPANDTEGSMTAAQARAILGVEEGVSPDELKKAWRRAAMHCHPDRYAELPARMQALAAAETSRINRAYQLLRSEPTKRTGRGPRS